MIASRIASGVVVAAALALAQPAAAEGVRIGVLECTVSSGFGFVLGSSRDVACVYLPAKGG
ncbi:MAG: DUF992 domain-containing protein, partial [Rhodospirillales bacterium]